MTDNNELDSTPEDIEQTENQETVISENNELENPPETFELTENQETESPETLVVHEPENQELDPPEEPVFTELQPNPWDDAPEGIVYYEKMFEDGHLGSFTKSAELAYKVGWFENTIPEEDLQVSDLNGWTYRKELCPMKGLAEKKQDKLREISNYTNRFEQNKCDEMYVVSSLGFRVNADRRSLQNVENLIRLGQETVFKDYDNQFHTVSVQDLETLLMEISANGSNLYNQKFQMQFAVMNFTTEQELENFEIRFEMMDFTTGD